LVLVVFLLVLIQAMRCLTLLKKLVVVQMQLLSATPIQQLQHQLILVTHIQTLGAAGVFGTTSGPDSVQNFSGSHTTSTATASITSTTTVASAGVSPTNTNYQPYITVYMWKRTV
jgi:hypothetical protein